MAPQQSASGRRCGAPRGATPGCIRSCAAGALPRSRALAPVAASQGPAGRRPWPQGVRALPPPWWRSVLWGLLVCLVLPPGPLCRQQQGGRLAGPARSFTGAGAAAASSSSFVTRSGSRLSVGGRPFYFLGCNSYWLTEAAGRPEGRSAVDRVMALARDTGVRVMRTWAFGHNLPAPAPAPDQATSPATSPSQATSPGSTLATSRPPSPDPAASGGGAAGLRGPALGLVWSEAEFQGLDFVVRQAEVYGLRLVLALGNLWPAYVAPEQFLKAAGVEDMGNLTVYDFYAHPGAREMYRRHIAAVTSRVNTYTGVQYKDSPSIMMWDVMNEPRCPGCMSAAQQATYQSWLAEMSAFTAAAAPHQLVAMGTEGFFADRQYSDIPSYVSFNPGAGSQCEGEDWVATSALPAVSVAVMHTYWRQTEGVPSAGWVRMTFEQYLQWYLSYTWLHVRLAGRLGKPLLQEEFNILASRFSATQRRQLFAAAFAQLEAVAAAGGPYAGAMWWSCAVQGNNDDNYNVYLDVPRRPPGQSPPVPLLGLPPAPVATSSPPPIQPAVQRPGAGSLSPAPAAQPPLAVPAVPNGPGSPAPVPPRPAPALTPAPPSPPSDPGPGAPALVPPPAAAGAPVPPASVQVAIHLQIFAVRAASRAKAKATSTAKTEAEAVASEGSEASGGRAAAVEVVRQNRTRVRSSSAQIGVPAGYRKGGNATGPAAQSRRGQQLRRTPKSPAGSSVGGTAAAAGVGGGGRGLPGASGTACRSGNASSSPGSWSSDGMISDGLRGGGRRTAAAAAVPTGVGVTRGPSIRKLQQVETLDAFRRADARTQCANAMAADWRPVLLPPLGAAASTEYTGLPYGELQGLLAAAAAGGDDPATSGGLLLDIIAATAARLNAISGL